MIQCLMYATYILGYISLIPAIDLEASFLDHLALQQPDDSIQWLLRVKEFKEKQVHLREAGFACIEALKGLENDKLENDQ